MKPHKRHNLLPRISRAQEGLASEGEGQLWAVSYSDLLMVLMSFFILFFSFENKEDAANALVEISSEMQSGGAKVASAARSGGVKSITEDFESALKQEGVNIEKIGKALVINFDQSAFASANFRLNSALSEKLKYVVGILMPHKEKIEITVIGHTDDRALVPRNEYLTNNFDLSALRALQAVKFMIDLGFPADRVFASGSASNERQTRSLSLRVTPRRDKS